MSYVDFKYALLRTSCSLAVMVILVMTLLSTLVQADNQAGYVSHASILLADNGQADAFAQSARTKAIQGDYTGAMADINMALQCDANHLGAIALRAFIRKKQGDKEGALQDYNKVIALGTKDYSVYMNRGNLRKEKGDYAGAAADQTAAISLDQSSPSPYYNRSNCRYALGQYREALADINEAIRLSKDCPPYYHTQRDQCKVKVDAMQAAAPVRPPVQNPGNQGSTATTSPGQGDYTLSLFGSQTRGGAGANAKLDCKGVSLGKGGLITSVSCGPAGFWLQDDKNTVYRYNNPQTAVNNGLQPGTYWAYPNLSHNQSYAGVTVCITEGAVATSSTATTSTTTNKNSITGNWGFLLKEDGKEECPQPGWVYKLTASGSSVSGTALCYEGEKLRIQCPMSGSIEGKKIVLSMDLTKTTYYYDNGFKPFTYKAGDMIKYVGTINNEGKSISGRYDVTAGGKGTWTAKKQ